MQAKTPEQSKTVLTDMVLPGETNPLNNLFGGELLARMDRAKSSPPNKLFKGLVSPGKTISVKSVLDCSGVFACIN